MLEVLNEIRLHPVPAIMVSGSYDATSWRYELSLPGPTQNHVRKNVPAESLLHFKTNVDHRRPWRGVSVFDVANVSVNSIAKIEASLQAEYDLPVTKLFAYDALSTEQGQELATSFKDAKGVNAVGLGHKDTYNLLDIRPEPNESILTSKENDLAKLVIASGIPPSLLLPRANAQAMREAYRQFILVTVNPILAMMAGELSEKLDTEIMLSAAPLHATNVSERARAYKLLVDAGHDKNEAARIAGIA